MFTPSVEVVVLVTLGDLVQEPLSEYDILVLTFE